MIDYKDILDLGFNRLEFGDSVHFDKFGYEYFILTKSFKIGVNDITFNWLQGKVKVYKNDDFVDIEFDNIHEFINLYKLFQ